MNATVKINGSELPVWYQDQAAEAFSTKPTMVLTHFDDPQLYFQRLTDKLFELEQDGKLVHHSAFGGVKIRNVNEWQLPEADLLLERVKYLANYVTGHKTRIELSWANIYRKGHYISAHSHTGTQGSLVYMLDPGDPAPKDHPMSGRFSVVDPRVEHCCPTEEGRMTQECSPELKAGHMILFPSYVVHYVHPYMGERPRITLSFNVNPE